MEIKEILCEKGVLHPFYCLIRGIMGIKGCLDRGKGLEAL